MLEQRPSLFRNMIPVGDVDYRVLDVESEAEVRFIERPGLEPAVVDYSHRKTHTQKYVREGGECDEREKCKSTWRGGMV